MRAAPLARHGLLLSSLLAVAVAQAQPAGGEAVAFPTRDAQGATLELRGMLWPAKGEPRGAVVLVHGSGGWSDHREGHYGRALSAAGYAVLAIDAFGPRGIHDTAEDQSKLSTLQMTRDAFAARRWLVDKGFAANHLAVMGFSKGGSVALYAADRNFLAPQAARFAAAVAFYPSCLTHPRAPEPAGAVYMALGEKDDYTGVKSCQELAADFKGAGGRITVKVYPDATHLFDGNPALTKMATYGNVENYIDCTVYLEPDGAQTYAGKRYAPADTTLFGDMRRTCIKKGATMWTNQRQKEAATQDAVAFLNAELAQ